MVFENKYLKKEQKVKVKRLLEKDIEKSVGSYAKRKGVLTDKFCSPSKPSVPDQMYTFPGGLIVLIEFKASGKKPTVKQVEDHRKRRDQGGLVYVVDNIEDGKRLVDHYLASGLIL